MRCVLYGAIGWLCARFSLSPDEMISIALIEIFGVLVFAYLQTRRPWSHRAVPLAVGRLFNCYHCRGPSLGCRAVCGDDGSILFTAR